MQFARINNVNIHYRHTKGAGNVTFVFINSLGTDFRIWDQVEKELQKLGDTLVFDNRGHGLSDFVVDTNGLDDFAADTRELMKHLNIGRHVLIGLSVGGMIAQLLAHRYPRNLVKLILCDTRHKIGDAKTWNDRIAAVRNNGMSAVSGGVMERWFSVKFRTANPDRVAGYKTMLERTPVEGYIKTCEAIRDGDLTTIAPKIKTPTICVVGSEDKSTTPEEVKSLAALIPESRFQVIDESGHIPCVDNPQKLTSVITEFLKS